MVVARGCLGRRVGGEGRVSALQDESSPRSSWSVVTAPRRHGYTTEEHS